MSRDLNDSGFSLIEMMIAMAAGTIVLSATIQSLHHFQKRLWVQQATIESHQDQRMGIRVMMDELRLAGTGAPTPDTAVLKSDRQAIEFLANVDGLTTTLREPVLAGQQELQVVEGSGWPKGKRIIICAANRCAESRLARDGRRTVLALTDPLDESLPAGSTVFVSNRVRYYLGNDQDGMPVLMRQLDGGANPLIGNVTWFQLRYRDRDGRPTKDPARVSHISIDLAVGKDRRMITDEVGLPAR